jgi:hypothetical protein
MHVPNRLQFACSTFGEQQITSGVVAFQVHGALPDEWTSDDERATTLIKLTFYHRFTSLKRSDSSPYCHQLPKSSAISAQNLS